MSADRQLSSFPSRFRGDRCCPWRWRRREDSQPHTVEALRKATEADPELNNAFALLLNNDLAEKVARG